MKCGASGEIGQQHHRRRRKIRLERADEPVAEHPRPLPDHHPGAPRQPAIDLGHDTGQRFLAHRDHAHLVLHLRQARDSMRPGMPARDAEDKFDPGLGEHPRHQHARWRLFLQHPLDGHGRSSRGVSGELATGGERWQRRADPVAPASFETHPAERLTPKCTCVFAGPVFPCVPGRDESAGMTNVISESGSHDARLSRCRRFRHRGDCAAVVSKDAPVAAAIQSRNARVAAVSARSSLTST